MVIHCDIKEIIYFELPGNYEYLNDRCCQNEREIYKRDEEIFKLMCSTTDDPLHYIELIDRIPEPTKNWDYFVMCSM
jgi:hypothetical protein